MAVATIAIGNLKSNALYVSNFTAQVYSDASYQTLVGTQSTPAVKDSSGAWIQSDLLSFPGLVRGRTYYIKAGPVSPGGMVTFSNYTVQAGTLTIPACTYSGTYTATSAGISYDITPANIPSDIDHYEAAWTKDASQPSNSSYENQWTGNPIGGVIHLFVGGSPGQQIDLFIRAVSTTGGYQNWVLVDQRTISNSPTSASGITYADGQTLESLKPAAAGADVTGNNRAADTASVNGINAGHVSDSVQSLGFVGKWWRTSSSAPAPSGGGELPYAPMFTTHDAVLNYNIWGEASWVGAISPPSFSSFGPTFDGQWIYARFTGYFSCSVAGTYTFGVNSDDGANLYVNGQQLVNDLANTHGANGNLTYTHSGTITLEAGEVYEVIVEYRNGVNNAGLQVLYTPPGDVAQLLNLGTAYKSAGYMQYSNGQTVDALRPAVAGADVTSQNTAAAIANQGALATVNQADTPNIVPGAVNSSLNYGTTATQMTTAGVETTLGSVTVTTDGGYVRILATITISGYTSNPGTPPQALPAFTLYKGDKTGTILTVLSNVAIVSQSSSVYNGYSSVSIQGIDTSPAASQLYTLTAQSSIQLLCQSVQILAENAKV